MEQLEVPTATFNSQLGRTHKKRPASDFGMTERKYDRAQDQARSTRQKKVNRARQRDYRKRLTAFNDLQAQIRVASGQTGASAAMVENAKRALFRKVETVQQENPDMTEAEAVEFVFGTAAGTR